MPKYITYLYNALASGLATNCLGTGTSLFIPQNSSEKRALCNTNNYCIDLAVAVQTISTKVYFQTIYRTTHQ